MNDMKQRYTVIVLFALILMSSLTSVDSYRSTSRMVSEDMDRALTLTMLEQQSDEINQDTIRVFNSHLRWAELRGKATIAVDTRQKKFTCYAKCSTATIFSLSDQRLTWALWTLTVLWGIFCWYRFRTREGGFGGILFSETEGQFITVAGGTIPLTPMQRQLMELFFRAPSHRLSKTEICDTLWPKKPDASDTLYTLIRRLRPIIEEHSNLKIESDRGSSYRLTEK